MASPVSKCASLGRADDEAGQIVFAGVIDAGHLRGLAADQRASVGAASARDAGDHCGRDVGIQFADREIIQEEQRQRALHGDVVDAVVHQILADGVVAAGEERDLQLGAHAVGRTHQHGLAESGQLERGAERADIGQHAARESAARELLDGGYGAIGFIDIDAGVAVAKGFLGWQISIIRVGWWRGEEAILTGFFVPARPLPLHGAGPATVPRGDGRQHDPWRIRAGSA